MLCFETKLFFPCYLFILTYLGDDAGESNEYCDDMELTAKRTTPVEMRGGGGGGRRSEIRGDCR